MNKSLTLYVRLHNIDVKGKTALVSLDEFFEKHGVNQATWAFSRDHDGLLRFVLRFRGAVVFEGVTRTLPEAVDMLTEGLAEMVDVTIANPVQFDAEGFDSMGLWTALG